MDRFPFSEATVRLSYIGISTDQPSSNSKKKSGALKRPYGQRELPEKIKEMLEYKMSYTCQEKIEKYTKALDYSVDGDLAALRFFEEEMEIDDEENAKYIDLRYTHVEHLPTLINLEARVVRSEFEKPVFVVVHVFPEGGLYNKNSPELYSMIFFKPDLEAPIYAQKLLAAEDDEIEVGENSRDLFIEFGTFSYNSRSKGVLVEKLGYGYMEILSEGVYLQKGALVIPIIEGTLSKKNFEEKIEKGGNSLLGRVDAVYREENKNPRVIAHVELVLRDSFTNVKFFYIEFF